MPKFFVKEEQITEKQITIIGQDVNHIKNVLRMKIDDKIDICNSNNSENFLCEIEEINQKEIICKILEKEKIEKNTEIKVSIFQALPKFDKMELIIQKSVELGVYDITPVEMKRCIVKLDEKNKFKKIERWQKISEVASKQCMQNIIPKINNIINLNNVCNLISNYDIVLVAYEKEQDNTLKQEINNLKKIGKKDLKIAVLIGPEGGIDETEIEKLEQAGSKIITLGKRILRTETVALNVLSILMYELEN